MGWVTQRGPRRCRFLDPERRLFSVTRDYIAPVTHGDQLAAVIGPDLHSHTTT